MYSKFSEITGAFEPKLWVPFTDEVEEGNFTSVYNSTLPLILSRHINIYLNGGTVQNCLYYKATSVSDTRCSYKYNFACEFEMRPMLKLKGLCDQSDLDLLYAPVNKNGQIEYQGYLASQISFNITDRRWSLRRRGELVAVSNQASSLLLGVSNWTVVGDVGCSIEDSGVPLSLTACTVQQFNCDDGGCIR